MKKYNSTLSAADAKRGDHKQNTSIRRKRSALALGGFLFTSLFALLAPLAEAQCEKWNVGHGWRFKQGPTAVQMNLHQNGTVVTGTATHVLRVRAPERDGGVITSAISGKARDNVTVNGTVDGTVEGDQFAVKIEWNNNTTGVYEGTIGPSGKIEGKGWERRSPRTKVRWYSETRMVCADAAPTGTKPASSEATKAELNAAADTWLNQERAKRKTATPPTPSASNKPRGFINGLQLGTPTPAPPVITSTQGEAGKSTRPYIRALPQIVSIPRGESEALTKLVWFAGNDHPDAQLVVAVNGGDERLVDPQRKGSREVKVKAGQRYVYTVIDAGQPLASVLVQTDRSPRPDRQRLRGEQRERGQGGESDNDENQGND